MNASATGGDVVSRWRSRLASVTAVTTLVTVALLLSLLPLAVRYLAVDWLQQHTGAQVRLEDVDLNLFTGSLGLRGLQVRDGRRILAAAGRARIEVSLPALLHRRVELQSVQFDGVTLVVERPGDGNLKLGGVAVPAADDAGRAPSWDLGIDALDVSDLRIDYRQPGLRLRAVIERLALHDLASWTPATPATLAVTASLDGAALRFEGTVAPFAQPALYRGRLQLDGLALADFRELAGVGGLQGRLGADSRFELRSLKSGLAITQSGRLQVEGLQLSVGHGGVRSQRVLWQGEARLDSSGVLRVQGDGRLQTGELHARLARPRLRLDQQAARVDGRFAFTGGEAAALDYRGQLALDGLAVQGADAGYRLLAAEALRLSAVEAEAMDAARAGAIEARGLRLGIPTPGGDEAAPALLTVDRLQAGPLDWRDHALALGTVRFEGADARLQRDAGGGLNTERLGAALAALTADGAGAEARGKTRGGDTRLRIAAIHGEGGNRLRFEDHAVQPPFGLILTFDRLAVGALDSGRPDDASPLQAAGTLGRDGRFRAEGEFKPFARPPAVQLEANIEGLQLPPLSSYTARALGVRLRSGTLLADTKLELAAGRLDSVTDLTLYQLDLTSLDNGQARKLQASLDMPLDAALDVLRDDNNTIHLKLPVRGDPAAPDFDFSDALRQALARGLRAGALQYLSMALQPYGTLISIAKFAHQQATRLRLDPVSFAAGSARLPATAGDYLSRIAAVLRKRPRIAVRVCGVAVEADRAVLAAAGQGARVEDRQLQALAKRRADAVRDLLVGRYRAPPARLVECLPEVETGDAKATPRVELLI